MAKDKMHMYVVTVDKSLPNGLGNVQVAANGTLLRRYVLPMTRVLWLQKMQHMPSEAA